MEGNMYAMAMIVIPLVVCAPVGLLWTYLSEVL